MNKKTSEEQCNEDSIRSYLINLPNSNSAESSLPKIQPVIINNHLLTQHGIALLNSTDEASDLHEISSMNSHLHSYQNNDESIISALNNELMSVINQNSEQNRNAANSYQLISDSLSSINVSNNNDNTNRMDSQIDYYTTINFNGHNIQMPLSAVTSFIMNKGNSEQLVNEQNQLCSSSWNTYTNCSSSQDQIIIDDKSHYEQVKNDRDSFDKNDGDTMKTFVCTYNNCGKRFKTSSELGRHAYRHTGEKPHKCDRCDKAFFRQDDLKRHYFTHTGEKLFKCDQCEFKCIQSYDLVKHKMIHKPEKPFNCELCSRRFTRPSRLKEHMRLHTGEKPFICNYCDRSFSQRTSYNAHMNSHNNDKSFFCIECNRSFTNISELQTHQNRHTGQRPHVCDICSKQFISIKTLKKHYLLHSGEKPFECEQCNRKFIRSNDLKLHSLIHAEEKPFKCNECDKSFTRMGTLKDHQRLHSGEFPFKCEICSKCFNHRSHLTTHLRIHSNDKSFTCQPCNKQFKRRISLVMHSKSHSAMSNEEDSEISGLCSETMHEDEFISEINDYNQDDANKSSVIMEFCKIQSDKVSIKTSEASLENDMLNILTSGTTANFKSVMDFHENPSIHCVNNSNDWSNIT